MKILGHIARMDFFPTPLVTWISSRLFTNANSFVVHFTCTLHNVWNVRFFLLNSFSNIFCLWIPSQPTTAASQNCQPNLMWKPSNCRRLVTHWSTHVSLASTWLEGQNTEPADLMAAGQGKHHYVQVHAF